MFFRSDVGQGEFGKGFADPDYGFQLADGDGNGGTKVGCALRFVDTPSDGDKM